MSDLIETEVTFDLSWLANIEREATILFTFLPNFKYAWCSDSISLKFLSAKAERTDVSLF